MTLAAYRDEGGVLFPSWDLRMPRELAKSLPDIEVVLKYCRARDVVVQAGGNVGLWPRRMSELFGAVYTFEPDPVNFCALAMNTADRPNIVRFQAALGCLQAFVELNRTGKNCGAHYVEGRGILPTLRLDDLRLEACDLIYLDIEGSELSALKGAVRTIGRHKPVVAFEDKGLGEKYGDPLGKAEEWMAQTFEYKTAAVNDHDVIMVPEC